MSLELCYIIVGVLILFAIFDLVVGVTNDAVNFLNSSIGSKAAPFYIIMIVASLGILAGVTFSGGMMEVARKGIFHPQFFTMPELLTIFLAVMVTDILLLDLFNTHGLPTSTTVSIVFELLGAAVAVSLIKIMAATDSAIQLWDYINTAKAIAIVGGILLSIVVAFFSGAIVQFISRLIFTFDYQNRIKKYGALWGGMALTAITFFILVKGAKGATFMDEQTVEWIKNHSYMMMAMIFVVSATLLQLLISLFKINILKPIVLIGTFALAMAFAANDLVNFIGVPLAGLNAFQNALLSGDPLTVTMTALSKKVHPQTFIMLISGAVMVITLWVSKKARTVTETEIRLGQQDEGTEKFESIWLSRKIVNLFDTLFGIAKNIAPAPLREIIARRLEPVAETRKTQRTEKPSFDLIRASVNLMVASAVVSFATSHKLPLSTTYVTFMVAMGSSFSDQAWGRESAVYRVTGVLTVIGGWFMTAFIAFVISFIFANILFYLQLPGIILIACFAGYMIWKNHQKHKGQQENKDKILIYNLHNVQNFQESMAQTFDHLAYLLKDIRESLDIAFEALFKEDLYTLRTQRMHTKHIQNSTNIIIANIFKVLRLLSKEGGDVSYNYYQIIRRLQKLSDGYRDTVIRSSMHVSNRHSGLLDVQIAEIREIKTVFLNIISMVEAAFRDKQTIDCQGAVEQFHYLRELVDDFNANQIQRIRDDSSKTRLSILFYAISGNCVMMAKQNVKLLDIFNESFKLNQKCS
ncbi:MAG: inorganic phosphate transporter [Proteobacteria bacterium]|nr:inorganic phosphate transporter [Pseudomonadota bacterium]MBU1389297.1 inorganic phosphate transporter [Pseudomonadota bacterium]MBU1544117.1 inorganic phosphate transporter [Pseudomonadota bacterium]MBU2481623.1 inorganic phosphate transporter [Pseudomonadota bacterium]